MTRILSDQSIKILFGNLGIDYFDVSTVDPNGRMRTPIDSEGSKDNYQVQVSNDNKDKFKSAGELFSTSYYQPKDLQYPCNPNNKAYFDFNSHFYEELNKTFSNYDIISGTEVCKNQTDKFTNRDLFLQEYDG